MKWAVLGALLPLAIAFAVTFTVAQVARFDHPNQVTNMLGFPFVFRGALDVRASAINEGRDEDGTNLPVCSDRN